jgi:hypothetical protein
MDFLTLAAADRTYYPQVASFIVTKLKFYCEKGGGQ